MWWVLYLSLSPSFFWIGFVIHFLPILFTATEKRILKTAYPIQHTTWPSLKLGCSIIERLVFHQIRSAAAGEWGRLFTMRRIHFDASSSQTTWNCPWTQILGHHASSHSKHPKWNNCPGNRHFSTRFLDHKPDKLIYFFDLILHPWETFSFWEYMFQSCDFLTSSSIVTFWWYQMSEASLLWWSWSY